MKPPIEPSKEDCCNSGCNPCIFDVYKNKLKLYKTYLESGVRVLSNYQENALSQLKYSTFILKKRTIICDLHIFLEFSRFKEEESDSDNRSVLWKSGDHFLLKYNSGDMSCTRAYTPIKQRGEKEYDFAIIVKVYNNGLVSNYLNGLNIGDKTLWRGPYGSYQIFPNKYNRIIMIAQGTGIAPFISIIEDIINNEDDMTKIYLYYCVTSEDTILLRSELYSFRQYWNFSYKLYLSYIANEQNYKYREPIVQHKLAFDEIVQLKPFSPSDQFLLCGSFNFMKHFETLLKKEDCLDNIVLF